MLDSAVMAALASPKRLQIMEWLRDPGAHFPRQRDGDRVADEAALAALKQKIAEEL